jgi:hypothetical protein
MSSGILSPPVHGAALLVAASTAPPSVKAFADYICDGTADDVQINAAIAAVTAQSGGRVWLSVGQFYLQDPVISDGDYVHLQGMGEGATVLLPQTAGTNLTALVILGNARNVTRNSLSEMRLYGRGDAGTPPATGHGAIINGNGCYLQNLWCTNVVQDGVRYGSVDGSARFEHYASNLTIAQCGNDGISIASTVSDCEFVACKLIGGQVPINTVSMTLVASPFGRYGIYNQGNQNKFTLCHPYFWQWGLYSVGSGTQVWGGEYETNQPGGGIHLESHATGGLYGVEIYDNLGAAIQLTNGCSGVAVSDCRIRPSNRGGLVDYAIKLSHCDRCVIHHNRVIQVSATGYCVHLSASEGVNCSDNIIEGNSLGPQGTTSSGDAGDAIYLTDGTTRTNVIGNNVRGKIREVGGTGTPTLNTFEHNDINYGGSFLTIIGSGSKHRHNRGFAGENSGTATIPSGSTSVVVDFNVTGPYDNGASPTVHVLPTNSLGSATKYWVDTFDIVPSGSQHWRFTLHVDVDPGVGGATFSWSARACV